MSSIARKIEVVMIPTMDFLFNIERDQRLVDRMNEVFPSNRKLNPEDPREKIYTYSIGKSVPSIKYMNIIDGADEGMFITRLDDDNMIIGYIKDYEPRYFEVGLYNHLDPYNTQGLDIMVVIMKGEYIKVRPGGEYFNALDRYTEDEISDGFIKTFQCFLERLKEL